MRCICVRVDVAFCMGVSGRTESVSMACLMTFTGNGFQVSRNLEATLSWAGLMRTLDFP